MTSLVKSQELFERRWFFIVALYLVVELARPQSVIPIGFLRPGLVTVLLLLLFSFKNGRVGTYINKQILLILSFTALLVVYIPFAINNYWAYQASLSMLLMIPFIISIPMLINSRERIIRLFWVFVLIGAFVSVYGLLHSGRGPGGVVSDENDLCLFLVTFLPFTLFLLTQQQQKFKKMFLLGVVFLTVLAAVATFSRGGFVGLVTMTAVYWWYSKNKALILFFAVLVVIMALIYGGQSYRQDMLTVTDSRESTARVRLLSWEAGWDMFLDHPLGVGGNNYPILFSAYQPPEFKRDMWGRHAHSLWFTLIPETGIIGILIYFSIIKLNLKDLKFLRNAQMPSHSQSNDTFYYSFSIAMLASFAGFLASASFLSVLYYPEFWYLTAILVSVRNVAVEDLEKTSNLVC